MGLGTVRTQENMDYKTLMTVLNQNFALLENLNITQIFKDDMGIPRVLLGKAPNGTYGLKVSKPGIDVTEATDDQLAFNSNQNTLKVVETGTITIPATTINSSTANGYASIDVPHSLGAEPAVIAFLVDNYGRRIPLPGFRTYEGTEDLQGALGPGDIRLVMPLNEYVTYAVDASKVTFYNWIVNKALPVGGSYTTTAVSIKYYILQESAI